MIGEIVGTAADYDVWIDGGRWSPGRRLVEKSRGRSDDHLVTPFPGPSAGPHRADVAQAAAFAAKTRLMPGLVTANTDRTVKVFCGCSVEDAAAVVDEAYVDLPGTGTSPRTRSGGSAPATASGDGRPPGASGAHRYGDPVRLVRYSHSCVRLEADGRTLVIDPGVWSEPQALHGAGAVLVTHFHADPRGPVAAGRARRPGVCAGADPGRRHHGGRGRGGVRTGRVRRPRPRRRHASVAGGEPDLPNLGYLVDGLYHPGDALHVPDGRVDTLLVPLQASWLKLAEALDFVRAVRPRRAYGIHDAQVNERGREGPNHWLGRTGAGYRWLAPGEAADLTG